VIQTSALDCGPAALKSLLAGFGANVGYARLRELCRTSLDGTSIDTIETVANDFGLNAEQIMLPADHLLIPAANALPAVVVVTLPNGVTHFVVVWRRTFGWLQVMDPAVGRRWIRADAFLRDVYRHSALVPACDALDFLASDDFTRVLQVRLRKLGIQQQPPPTPTLDAAVRFLQALVDSHAVRKGRQARFLLERLCARPDLIPAGYWCFIPAEDEQIRLRGAVLIRASRGADTRVCGIETHLGAFRPAIPGAIAILLFALLMAAGGTFLEALLFRGLLDASLNLALAGQRLAAMAALLLFSFGLLLLEIPLFSATLRIGRQLETSFRMAFLNKLPRIADRYFQSRPIADMAERSHVMHRLRQLPDQIRQLLSAILQLTATAGGIVWLEPRAWPLVLLTLLAALIPLFNAHFVMAERDTRVRTHSGGLMRFYLDAMLGLVPIRAHGAGRALWREHDRLLGEWASASVRLQRAVVAGEALQLAAMFGLVVMLLLSHAFAGADIGRVLLIAYWALNMPALGQNIATVTRQYPHYRSLLLRLFEPLNASEEPAGSPAIWAAAPSLEFRNVSVGTFLSSINIHLAEASQTAIVGPSGAGKSSLLALLLGWLTPDSGDILVNGRPLDFASLRAQCAWVDPAVQLWNESLQDNLTYGAAKADLAMAIDTAALRNLLEGLPDGLQTKLGENGGLISGGEGQRVRFGRALARRDARVVLLDEPFRGLDGEKRRDLLAKARHYWRGATLLCVTHDLRETQTFDRVLVVEQGRIVEDGCPCRLKANARSRYSQLLRAEESTRMQLWQSSAWRRIQIAKGRLSC
jgi:ATP-binding cassette subfamily B protein